MGATLLALLAYGAWTLALLIGIAILRSFLTLSGRRAANAFAPSGSDVSEFSGRLCRAHANCYENLPLFGAVAVVAVVSGNAAITDPLALWVVLARVGQSVVHLASTSSAAVIVRFHLFGVQVAILAYWVVRLVSVSVG